MMEDPAAKLLEELGLTPKKRGPTTDYWRSVEEIRPGLRWWAFHRKLEDVFEFGVMSFAGSERWRGPLERNIGMRDKAGVTFAFRFPVHGLNDPVESATAAMALIEATLDAADTPYEYATDLDTLRKHWFAFTGKVQDGATILVTSGGVPACVMKPPEILQ